MKIAYLPGVVSFISYCAFRTKLMSQSLLATVSIIRFSTNKLNSCALQRSIAPNTFHSQQSRSGCKLINCSRLNCRYFPSGRTRFAMLPEDRLIVPVEQSTRQPIDGTHQRPGLATLPSAKKEECTFNNLLQLLLLRKTYQRQYSGLTCATG